MPYQMRAETQEVRLQAGAQVTLLNSSDGYAIILHAFTATVRGMRHGITSERSDFIELTDGDYQSFIVWPLDANERTIRLGTPSYSSILLALQPNQKLGLRLKSCDTYAYATLDVSITYGLLERAQSERMQATIKKAVEDTVDGKLKSFLETL